MASDLEQLGGREALASLIDTFVDRVRSDMMIGFFFSKIDPARLKEHEFSFALGHRDASEAEKTPYQGRPLRVAHGPHRIMGGQFNRRLQILKKVLQEAGAPAEVTERWLAHNESLRAHISGDAEDECAARPLDD